MKQIIKISNTELKKLFYSPVAWMILVIFTIQVALSFTDILNSIFQFASIYPQQELTFTIFSSVMPKGTFQALTAYLYLYVPLLTMNMISRELNTGSIKLLYSSPVTNLQIILGKYLALVAFGFCMLCIPALFGFFGMFAIQSVNISLIISALMGIYLLICAYAAIGLFMSSLTSYSVVAAMGTLGILAAMGYVKYVGQDIALVRDITYWISISGRAQTLITGLIASEDIIYFLLVILIFLAFTYIKMQSDRQKIAWWNISFRYIGVFFVVAIIGYITSLPTFNSYIDVTATQMNTLSENSRKVVQKIKGPLKITAYTNMLDGNFWIALPNDQKIDLQRFEQYIRFKPDVQLKYEYYWHSSQNPALDKVYSGLTAKQRIDTLTRLNRWKFDIKPYSKIADQIDLSGESFRFVRVLENASGKKVFLRTFNDIEILPFEAQISAAMKKLEETLPIVGFLSGHGERVSSDSEGRGYKMFTREQTSRHSLINNGFEFRDISLNEPVDDAVGILIIAELRNALTNFQQKNLQQFIDRGGNLFIAGEAGREDFMNTVTTPLGIRFTHGQLAKMQKGNATNMVLSNMTEEGAKLCHYFEDIRKRHLVLPLVSTNALEVSQDKGFKVSVLFRTDSLVWNESTTKDFVNSSATKDNNEQMRTYPTMMALSRIVNNKKQKIIISGDSDWLSNAELGMNRLDIAPANFPAIDGAFYWLSDEKAPIDVRHPESKDNKLLLSQAQWDIVAILFKWILPLVLMTISVTIWFRRKNR